MNITVNIRDGLGNQIFQYTFAYGVSKKINQPFKLDMSDFDTYGDLHQAYWNRHQLNVLKTLFKSNTYFMSCHPLMIG
ncbi:hypothetical protein MNB_SUP05-SYMBIONT-5-228 [hydrothermal vent metagenome]|uniref:Uncharacterized protein n=1 Tax=hydrothermal vent metagenome TaxID=652676 RepID=A0A1W1E0D8_9ZZZZ